MQPTGANGNPVEVKINISDLGNTNPKDDTFIFGTSPTEPQGGLGAIFRKNELLVSANRKNVSLDLSGSTFTEIRTCSLTTKNIKGIILPDTLAKINARAFLTAGFEEIALPANVQYIGNACLGNNMLSVTINNGNISNANFKESSAGWADDVRNLYFGANGGKGTYSRQYANGSFTAWTKN